ncbi:MAG: TIGR03767 family metallophosphoesterase [Actinomycetes bacterium]
MARDLTRRAFLRRSAGLTAATWGASLWFPGAARARTRTLGIAVAPEGTTLLSTFAPAGTDGYVRLVEAPGYPQVVRALGAEPRAGREDRRTALATIVHLTDVHVIDAQSTTRVEFLDRDSDPPQDPVPFSSAYRSQETMTCQVGDAMIRRLNTIAVGPIAGRPFDVAVSTGDNIDNQQVNELDWFIGVLDGGRPVEPNSGDLERYEGVQDTDATTYDVHYWHPDPIDDPRGPDRYKSVFGFPDMPGLLEAAIAPFTPEGLRIPWYSAYGNHDGLVQGNAPQNAVFTAISTGPLKITSRPAGVTSADLIDGLQAQEPGALAALASAPGRPVTPDARRAYVSPQEWIQAHLDSSTAARSNGHGYAEDALESGILHYTFPIADGVLGISLDTTNRGGSPQGSVGQAQLDWLEARLVETHGRHLDAGGAEVVTGNEDQLVVLFSHHNIASLNAPIPDPEMPDDARVTGDVVLELLHRFPNVVAWVNGHSHVNRVIERPDPAGVTGGFWEVITAAHVDAPQHSRIVELVDNADGTLSIHVTVVDHAGPAQADVAADVLALASISRELAFNDPQGDVAGALGEPGDRNVELVMAAPFDLAGLGGGRTAAGTDGGADEGTAGVAGALPATGGGSLALGLGAAALAGAVALRDRRPTRVE